MLPTVSAPAFVARSSDAFTRSNAFTLWPALRRLRHMGPPMFPRPMKPIVVMAVLPSLLCCRLIFERQVIPTERCEVEFDLRLANFFEYRRLPARRQVLVDHHGTNPFEKVMAAHNPLADRKSTRLNSNH